MCNDLFEACRNGDLERVKRLVESGFDPKANDNLPIQWASAKGHLEVVKYLVGLGCDPKTHNNWAIQSASENGHLEVVKYLVSLGCDPQADDNRTIKWASYYGHLEVVKYLLEMGCDHKTVKKDLKYDVLCEVKNNLNIWLSKKITNKWLKMEILKLMVPYFTEWEIMTIVT